MDRTEVYIKPYHVFPMYEKYFIFKVKSLYYSEITAGQYEVLESLEGVYRAEVTSEIRAILDEYNVLSPEPISEESERNFDEALWNVANERLGISSIELMVAQTCNMNCVYCYGEEGHYGQRGADLMNSETAFAAIDFLKRQVDATTDGVNDFIGIAFFGGEPLLNIRLIRQCVKYAEELFGAGRVTFGITTNLTLITDEILDFFAAHHIEPLISFDGPREYQVKHRRLNNGRDSYDTIVPLIKKTLARLPGCSGRATMFYGEDEEAIEREFRELGFDRYSVVPVSGSLIDGKERQDKFLWYRQNAELLQQRIHEFITAVKREDEKVVRELLTYRMVKGTVCYGAEHGKLQKKLMSCGVGRTMVAVSTEGKLYPCHRFVGTEKYCLGDLKQMTPPGEELSEMGFEKHQITENPQCSACYLKYSCGGGCMHEHACDTVPGGGGSIHCAHPDFCRMEKTKMKMDAYVHAALTKKDVQWLKDRKILFLERFDEL